MANPYGSHAGPVRVSRQLFVEMVDAIVEKVQTGTFPPGWVQYTLTNPVTRRRFLAVSSRCRVASRKEIALRLVSAGVEPNPGPSTQGPASSAKGKKPPTKRQAHKQAAASRQAAAARRRQLDRAAPVDEQDALSRILTSSGLKGKDAEKAKDAILGLGFAPSAPAQSSQASDALHIARPARPASPALSKDQEDLDQEVVATPAPTPVLVPATVATPQGVDCPAQSRPATPPPPAPVVLPPQLSVEALTELLTAPVSPPLRPRSPPRAESVPLVPCETVVIKEVRRSSFIESALKKALGFIALAYPVLASLRRGCSTESRGHEGDDHESDLEAALAKLPPVPKSPPSDGPKSSPSDGDDNDAHVSKAKNLVDLSRRLHEVHVEDTAALNGLRLSDKRLDRFCHLARPDLPYPSPKKKQEWSVTHETALWRTQKNDDRLVIDRGVARTNAHMYVGRITLTRPVEESVPVSRWSWVLWFINSLFCSCLFAGASLFFFYCAGRFGRAIPEFWYRDSKRISVLFCLNSTFEQKQEYWYPRTLEHVEVSPFWSLVDPLLGFLFLYGAVSCWWATLPEQVRKVMRSEVYHYIPHALSCVLAEFNHGTSDEVMLQSLNQKYLRLSTLPIPDWARHELAQGTMLAARAVMQERHFQERTRETSQYDRMTWVRD